MKRVIPLLLLVLVMCQCNNRQPEQQNEPVKTARELYPEKYTEGYIGERALHLMELFSDCDGNDDLEYKPLFSERYYDLLKEANSLPKEFITELAGAWLWVYYMEYNDPEQRVTEVDLLDDSTATVMMNGQMGDYGVELSFAGDDWVIDDMPVNTREQLSRIIQQEREWFKSLDFQKMMDEFEDDEAFTKEEYVAMVEWFKQEVDTYFAKYPDK